MAVDGWDKCHLTLAFAQLPYILISIHFLLIKRDTSEITISPDISQKF